MKTTCLEINKKILTFWSLLSSRILLIEMYFSRPRTPTQSSTAPMDIYKRKSMFTSSVYVPISQNVGNLSNLLTSRVFSWSSTILKSCDQVLIRFIQTLITLCLITDHSQKYGSAHEVSVKTRKLEKCVPSC